MSWEGTPVFKLANGYPNDGIMPPKSRQNRGMSIAHAGYKCFEISTLSTRVFECPWHIFNGGRSSLLVPTYILQSGSTLHREALCIWTLAWALCFWDRGMARDSHPNSSLVPQF